MSLKDPVDKRIRDLIIRHENWKNQWKEVNYGFSVEWVSPRGKYMTYSAYCSEVEKHLQNTIKKIRETLDKE
jgi:hypothetical protein